MSSRKEQKEALKQERLEREQAEAVGGKRRRLVGYGVGGLIVGVAVAVVVILLTTGGDEGATQAGGSAEATPVSDGSDELPSGEVPPRRIEELEPAARAANCELETKRSEGSTHVQPGTEVPYKANPPTSGDHYPNPAEDGAYARAPTTGRGVHSLEHGRIYVQYRAQVPDAVKQNLKALFDEDPYHVILAPNGTGMRADVAATTWTHSLVCPKMNDGVYDAIRAFKETYRDRGPEFVP